MTPLPTPAGASAGGCAIKKAAVTRATTVANANCFFMFSALLLQECRAVFGLHNAGAAGVVVLLGLVAGERDFITRFHGVGAEAGARHGVGGAQFALPFFGLAVGGFHVEVDP